MRYNYDNANIVVLFMLAAIYTIWYSGRALATVVLVELAVAYYMDLLPTKNGLFLPVVFISFAIGFLFDIALNLYFRYSRATPARGSMLESAVFTGAVTVIMTVLTLIASGDVFYLRLPNLDTSSTFSLNDGALICLVGFVMGAFIGIPAQNSRAQNSLAMEDKSTSDFLKNRAWDGGLQALSMVFVQIVMVFVQERETSDDDDYDDDYNDDEDWS